jgi:type IV pilus assembly protein PilO
MKPIDGSPTGINSFFAKIEKLSKVQRILIFSGVFVLIICIFVYASFKPKFQQISKLNKDLKTLEQKLKVAQANAADLEKFQKKMQEAEAEFKTAMKQLPEKEEIPSLLTSISRSGQDVGLEFLLFEPKPEVRKEFYAEIPVAMQVIGGYHDLAVFFDKVARLSRIVNIKNITMGRAGSAKGNRKNQGQLPQSDELSTSCTAVTYKFVEPAPEKPSKKKTRNSRRKK